MSKGLIISNHVHIRKDAISLNGERVFPQMASSEVKELLKALYQEMNIDYPKFFKMDSLCQLALIGAELLLKGNNILSRYPKDQIAILLSNSASSLDTDRRYHETINNADQYFPSPAVFVYTLPSIMNGEIAIRHGITGENSFLITREFDPEALISSIEDVFAFTDTRACITGWVNVDGQDFDAAMYLVESGEEGAAPDITEVLRKA